MMSRVFIDKLFSVLFKVSGFSAVAILGGIFCMLVFNGLHAFTDISLSEFFGTPIWSPGAFDKPKYGILSMVIGSFLVTALSLCIAIPIGIATAAYISEFAPKWLANLIKPSIEMLAAVPSVTIGFLGIVVIGPLLCKLFGIQSGLNALNASILLAIMSLPTIISMAEDALYSVPVTYKEASTALGASKWETLVNITIPAASSGITAAIMLGMGRVIGETMTVLMAAGNALAIPKNIFSPVRPMTATIAIEMGEVPFFTLHYYALFAVGIVLFIITFFINVLADQFINKTQNKE